MNDGDTSDRYHHGDLRGAVLRRAAEVIAAEGMPALRMRSLATDLGVTHTAPLHHFGSRDGVLEALAVQGFELLRERLEATVGDDPGERLVAMGVAYVRFAREHPAHFTVMFDPAGRGAPSAAVDEAGRLALGVLRAQEREAAGSPDDAGPGASPADRAAGGARAAASAAAWALVHGLAALVHRGSLERSGLADQFGGDLDALVRAAIGTTDFRGRPAATAGPADGSAVRRADTPGRHGPARERESS